MSNALFGKHGVFSRKSIATFGYRSYAHNISPVCDQLFSIEPSFRELDDMTKSVGCQAQLNTKRLSDVWNALVSDLQHRHHQRQVSHNWCIRALKHRIFSLNWQWDIFFFFSSSILQWIAQNAWIWVPIFFACCSCSCSSCFPPSVSFSLFFPLSFSLLLCLHTISLFFSLLCYPFLFALYLLLFSFSCLFFSLLPLLFSLRYCLSYVYSLSSLFLLCFLSTILSSFPFSYLPFTTVLSFERSHALVGSATKQQGREGKHKRRRREAYAFRLIRKSTSGRDDLHFISWVLREEESTREEEEWRREMRGECVGLSQNQQKNLVDFSRSRSEAFTVARSRWCNRSQKCYRIMKLE